MTFQHTKITDIILRKEFILSVELFPPRNGISPNVIFKKLDRLKRLDIDFISITKGAGGSHRGGTVPIGFMIGDRFNIEPLVHFRCRDLTKHDVENQLVDHIYFDIKNILAILGDALEGQEGPELDPEQYNIYASHLVGQMDRIRSGEYLALPGSDVPKKGTRADFCIGVAAYPDAGDMEKEMFVIKEKVKAGADFAITQMIFDIESYKRYVMMVREAGIQIPVIPGIRPVSKKKHLIAAKEVFGAKLTPELTELLADEGTDNEEISARCLEYTLNLCAGLKESGAPGIHLFILNDVDLAEKVIKGLGERD
jgi:methylenetetrahydrofolate reductase (NADPH)